MFKKLIDWFTKSNKKEFTNGDWINMPEFKNPDCYIPLFVISPFLIKEKSQKEVKKIKEKLGTDRKIFPVAFIIPFKLEEEDLKILEESGESLLEEVEKLLEKEGYDRQKMSVKQELEALCSLVSDGILSVEKLFWAFFFYASITGLKTVRELCNEKDTRKE
jgi:hypothetical protein